MISTTEVLIGGWTAGHLQRTASGRIGFLPQQSWATAPDAPVLGQSFIDEPTRPVWGGRTGELPCFFANLLPQGVNRDLLVEVHQAEDELDLLVKLGSDLPGAVIVRSSDRAVQLDEPGEASVSGPETGFRIKASLTGMQPKFSMSRTPHGFTLPAVGEDGEWIVKLPGRLRRSPEVEYATMCWARAAGLVVPETVLVPLEQVRGVPLPRSPTTSKLAFACRRFDREGQDRRIHQEDFAQVLGLWPREVSATRGRIRSHAAQGRVIQAVCPEDLHVWFRWLVFNILSGNSDAHQKNLAFWYPTPRQARLAPSYDLLAQVVYPEFTPELELHVCGVRRFQELGLDHLLALGHKIGAPLPEPELRAMVGRTLQAWSDTQADLPLDAIERERICAHLRQIPLARVGA